MPDAPPRAVLSPAFRLVFRLEIANRPGMFAHVATVIGERGCSLGAIDLVEATLVLAIAKAVAAATREAGLARKTAALEP